MVRVLFFALLVVAPFLSFSASAFNLTAVRDSVGVERKNGKFFLQHRVEPGQTLYALSRKYSVPVSKIVEANPKVQQSINVGQIVLIPRTAPVNAAVATAAKTPVTTTPAATASNRTFTVSDKGDKIHVVESGQTLFSISRMHGVTVDNIKRWNNLTSNQLNVGDQIKVGKTTATPTKKPIYVAEADEEITKPKTTETATASASPAKAEPVAAATGREATNDDDDNVAGIKKIVESGMAEMIDPKSDTNKYLALHKSAPVGTIMQVKNAMNGQVVYVRVIGRLPETGTTDKVLVRVSKKAYQKLGAVDAKFRVEVSYMP
ncbi:LysM peptidoglycan-binding domain-containing protein [Pontibacter vulgaris]|uniref:LysM peptidoglycan-binding domain-containing protein n=1 Tax=Pontibacter vulgaris TaxID=2905679 RepID=UPI001FA80C47|nr:LysM peptidoglycan-binding domain-containing protein [Pontibacter vulgaris]